MTRNNITTVEFIVGYYGFIKNMETVMAKILVLKSSIMGEGSQTNRLIDVMLEHRKDQGLQDDITIRNLAEMNLPVLDLEIFQALRGAENNNQDIQ